MNDKLNLYGDERGWWKGTALFMAGVVLTMTMAWATQVRGAMTRQEVVEYVNTRQGNLERRMDELQKDVRDLREAAARIEERVGRGTPR